MELGLDNKVAFVSGSSRGLGFAIAKRLTENGAKVVLNGRCNKRLLEASKELGSLDYFCGDIAETEVSNACVKYIEKKYGGVDVLVCNVGTGKSAATGSQNLEDWQHSLRDNLFSATVPIEAFDELLSINRGVILCVSSICGVEFVPGAPATYSSSKAALNSFVKNSSKYFGPKGVTVNALAPGNLYFAGSVWEKKMEEHPIDVKRFLEKEVALQKFVDITELANLAVYLCSERGRILTGSIIVADAGQVRS